MIYYTDPDESILIGISASDRSEASIAKIVGKLLAYDMVEADSNAFDDVNEFAADTVVVSVADFTEELLDLLDKDIKVYLV